VGVDPRTRKVYLKVTVPNMMQEIKEAYAEDLAEPAKPSKTLLGYPWKQRK